MVLQNFAPNSLYKEIAVHHPRKRRDDKKMKEKYMDWKRISWKKPFYEMSVVGVALVFVVIGLSGCIEGGLASPTVENVPNNWYLSDKADYGTYEGTYDWNAGMVEFTDSEDGDFVQIYYEYAPEGGLSHDELESDALYLLEEVLEFYEIELEPSEVGIMNITDTEVGYAKSYSPETNCYDLEIVMILEGIYLDIYSYYDATSEDEDQVISLINSISVNE